MYQVRSLRIALAQINPTVGDLNGNVTKITEYIQKAKKVRTDVVVFPELAITGYPPEDLVLKSQFIDDNLEALRKVRKQTAGIIAVVGFVDRKDDIYNAAAVLSDKRLLDTYHKDKGGGTGETFDWSLVDKLEFDAPFVLAGGLTVDNVGEAISKTRPYAVDVNSGIEKEPGRKDVVLIEKLVERVRAADQRDKLTEQGLSSYC